MPTVHEVTHIAQIADPVIRNLRITECYHRLSRAMATRTGASANWCTFATWASRQAGRTIRGEDFLDKLTATAADSEVLHPIRSCWRWLLRRGLLSPTTRFGRLIHEIHSPFDAFERASAAVARGNRKVFEEIGLEFARYLHTCPVDADLTSTEFLAFLAGLREGEPAAGQQLLRHAFALYQQHAREAPGRRKAQLLFLANLEIGLHEQTRLQPEIAEAMLAGPTTAHDLGERALRVLCPWRLGPMQKPASSLLALPALRFHRFLQALTYRVVTECLMVLVLPQDAVLALGQHLEHPYAALLEHIDEPDVHQLLARYEPLPGTADDCGAQNWSELEQRMHYIIHLFRVYHDRPALFEAPFTSEQIHQVMQGQLPECLL